MPIRVVKDDDNDNVRDNYPGGGDRPQPGGGGGGGPLNFLPMLLMFLFKNPKLLIIALVGLAAWWFFGGGNLGNLGNLTEQTLSTGCSMNKEIYAQTEVFEPLADNSKNPLPEKTSLLAYAPARGNQGSQGSCVAWSSAYAGRSILYNRQTNNNGNEAFSPSYLYNQIKLPNCQGSYIKRAMDAMMQTGGLPLSQFPYNEESCSRLPDQSQVNRGAQFNIKGYQRLSRKDDDLRVDMLAVKQYLSQGSPVIIGMLVGGSFMQPMVGKDRWEPDASDYQQQGFGGHAMCVIGYDDFKYGKEGGFQIMNSWGPEWGNNGVGWVRYKDFDYFVQEAYAMYPMGGGPQFDQNKLHANISFVINDKNYIPLIKKGENTFATQAPIAKMTKFKIEIANPVECYTYVFGQETDGSSYVIFPYTAKHSPYCGITGTRLFPKDYSLQADQVGNKDIFAIVVTKKPVDYKVLNAAINASKLPTYAAKVNEAIAAQKVDVVQHAANAGQITLAGNLNGKNAMAAIIEMDKK